MLGSLVMSGLLLYYALASLLYDVFLKTAIPYPLSVIFSKCFAI